MPTTTRTHLLWPSILAATCVALAMSVSATGDDSTKRQVDPNHEISQHGGLAEDFGIPGFGDRVCSCSEYRIGDLVVSRYAYDNGLSAGKLGIILGGRTLEGGDIKELLVGWTEFQGGHTGLDLQDCPDVMSDSEDIQNACTYVLCEDVVPVPIIQCACHQQILAGQRVITNHTMTSGPGPGATGTVLAGLDQGAGSGFLLVAFDSWDEGHGGNGFTDQTCPRTDEEGSNRWFVSCEEFYPIILPAPPACTGDLDQNGIIDGADLQVLLGNWGFCPL